MGTIILLADKCKQKFGWNMQYCSVETRCQKILKAEWIVTQINEQGLNVLHQGIATSLAMNCGPWTVTERLVHAPAASCVANLENWMI